MTDIAIAHDQFQTMGGAEKVAFEIARTFDAPIYAMRVDDGVPPEDVEVNELSGDWGQWLMRRHYLVQDAYQFLQWQHVPDLYDHDVVIQTKNNPMWFVPEVDRQTVLRYSHTPPRAMFDLFRHRAKSRKQAALWSLERILYRQTTPYADAWACNSEVVERRLERYLDPSSASVETIYPPVEVQSAGPDVAETQDYYFYIGRLAVNKRIGLLASLAEQIDTKIVVAGDGNYRNLVEDVDVDGLEYLGRISEQEKWRRLSEAKATLFPAESEDFGIVPIESFASGTPVIGVNEGYTQHQIVYGTNGYLANPTVDSYVAQINLFEDMGVDWSEEEIAEFAEQFSTERFRREMRDWVDKTLAESEVTTPWEEKYEAKTNADD